MTNCFPEELNKGGAGQYESNSNPATTVFNTNDYSEVKYNASCKTYRYSGWTVSGPNYYANSYCVLKRGYSYQILTNISGLAAAYIHGVNNSSIPIPPGPLSYSLNHNGVRGYTCRMEYPKTPSDPTNLITSSGGSYWITIPSNYPILYCNLSFGFVYEDNNIGSLQKITIYIIFDLPPTSGTDVKTELTSQARCEYLYHDSSAEYIPGNIDLAGPWITSANPSASYYANNSSSGINFNSLTIYRLACAAAYNMKLGYDAAEKIQNFTNYLIHGGWHDITIFGEADWHPVNDSLYYITMDMAADPVNNIIRDPSSPGVNHTNDALGLHSKDSSPDGMYLQNNWRYECFDFAAISTAFDRAIGLAARQTTGCNYDNPPYGWDRHVWTEVWIPNSQSSNTSRDDQWCVFDACGVKHEDGEKLDSDINVSLSNTTKGYYSSIEPYWGKPTSVWIYFSTTNSGTYAFNVTANYKP